MSIQIIRQKREKVKLNLAGRTETLALADDVLAARFPKAGQ